MSFSHRFLANESASLKKAQDEALKGAAGQEPFSGNFSGTPYKSMGGKTGQTRNDAMAQYSFKVNNYQLGNSNFSNTKN